MGVSVSDAPAFSSASSALADARFVRRTVSTSHSNAPAALNKLEENAGSTLQKEGSPSILSPMALSSSVASSSSSPSISGFQPENPAISRKSKQASSSLENLGFSSPITLSEQVDVSGGLSTGAVSEKIDNAPAALNKLEENAGSTLQKEGSPRISSKMASSEKIDMFVLSNSLDTSKSRVISSETVVRRSRAVSPAPLRASSSPCIASERDSGFAPL